MFSSVYKYNQCQNSVSTSTTLLLPRNKSIYKYTVYICCFLTAIAFTSSSSSSYCHSFPYREKQSFSTVLAIATTVSTNRINSRLDHHRNIRHCSNSNSFFVSKALGIPFAFVSSASSTSSKTKSILQLTQRSTSFVDSSSVNRFFHNLLWSQNMSMQRMMSSNKQIGNSNSNSENETISTSSSSISTSSSLFSNILCPREVLKSYKPADFVPVWYGQNNHVQTILGAQAHIEVPKKILFGKENAELKWYDIYHQRRRWNTDDNDFFHVDSLLHDFEPETEVGSEFMVEILKREKVKKENENQMDSLINVNNNLALTHPDKKVPPRGKLKVQLTGSSSPTNPKNNSSSSSSSTSESRQSRSIVIVLHGLESSSNALLPRSMARNFFNVHNDPNDPTNQSIKDSYHLKSGYPYNRINKGFDVHVVNFRSCCGEGENNQPYAYHLGWTKDLATVVKHFQEDRFTNGIYFAGFSLGANVILKFLAEAHDQNGGGIGVGLNKIRGAVVDNVPFNGVLSSKKLEAPFNNAVYCGNFLSTLMPKAKGKLERFPRAYSLEDLNKCKTIGDFDDCVIAKLHDFEDKIDYYTKSDTVPRLKEIQHVPAYIIHAIDDPFVDEKGLPDQKKDVDQYNASVKLVYHEKGGHCGFIEEGESPIEEQRWLPREMGKFLNHVEHLYLMEEERKKNLSQRENAKSYDKNNNNTNLQSKL